MSGTSLDGLDICYVQFEYSNSWKHKILCAETVSYSKFWEDNLKNAIDYSAVQLLALNSEYGFYLGEKVHEFITKNQISEVDLIASHGHTIFHQPDKKFTTQIGDGRAIKEIVNFPVVYDFRSQDVLKGGNGAPLVPIGDDMLFSNFDACVNLGGFSNISFQYQSQRVAFDICPVNIVLNLYAKKLGKSYDENGEFARKGQVAQELLIELNSIKFYKQNFPKSLGLEWVNENILPLLSNYKPLDIITTCTQHFADQISLVLNRYQLNKVLFSGGGAYNSYLMDLIRAQTTAEIVIGDKILTEYKEALIFAFMGVLRLRNENNVLSSATGSTSDHCSGILI